MAWPSLANSIFCDEEDVERRTGLDFTTDSEPTLAEAEQNAVYIASRIVKRTETAGSKEEPPRSTITDTYLRDIIREANAVGAAVLCLQQVMRSSGPRLQDLLDKLENEWLSLFGNIHLGGDKEGLIVDIITEGSGITSSFTDADSGETTLKVAPDGDAVPPFTINSPADDVELDWP